MILIDCDYSAIASGNIAGGNIAGAMDAMDFYTSEVDVKADVSESGHDMGNEGHDMGTEALDIGDNPSVLHTGTSILRTDTCSYRAVGSYSYNEEKKWAGNIDVDFNVHGNFLIITLFLNFQFSSLALLAKIDLKNRKTRFRRL